MNAHEFNQSVIDQAMRIHEQCMDHVLDTDTSVYDFWCTQRDRMVIMCKQAALAAREQDAWINRFNTHRETGPMRMKRFIAARKAASGA